MSKNMYGDMNETKQNKILIVDDEPSNLTALSSILNKQYQLYVSRDGKDAIEVAKKQKPDLIILDVVMPDMDGFEVMRVLKAEDETKEIPVIFITGLTARADEEKGLELGAVDYINKPFGNAIVRLRVKNQIQLVNSFRTIARLSVTDALTGKANRRNFNIQFAKEWRRSIREKQSIGLLIIDIDNFKKYNDTYGHLAGDALLVALSDTIKEKLNRPMDLLARWGGEEFVVLLPGTDKTGAVKIARSIRAAVEEQEFLTVDGFPTRVTVSIGASSAIPAEQAHESEDAINVASTRLVAVADEGLYEAKETGKNKVCFRDYMPSPL